MKRFLTIITLLSLTGCVTYQDYAGNVHHKVKGCLVCDYDIHGNNVGGRPFIPVYVPQNTYHPLPVYQMPVQPIYVAPVVVQQPAEQIPAPVYHYRPVPDAPPVYRNPNFGGVTQVYCADNGNGTGANCLVTPAQ